MQVNASLWGVSPGFESNDLGFHSNGDRAGAHAVVLWRNVTPGRVTARPEHLGRQVVDLELRRELQGDGLNVQANGTFLNYWSAGTHVVDVIGRRWTIG